MADGRPAVETAPGGDGRTRCAPTRSSSPPVWVEGRDAPTSSRRTASSSLRSLSQPLRTLRFNTRVLDVAVCAGAYLYGSVPLLYLLARQRQVDLKRVGSGNVGATNLMASGGAARAAAGWIFDASKGLAPVLVSRRLGRARAVAELAGVCGVAGQCWPLFLRFSGGRGISAYVGAGAGMDRIAWSGSLLPMIGGSLWRVGGQLKPRLKGTRGAEGARGAPLHSHEAHQGLAAASEHGYTRHAPPFRRKSRGPGKGSQPKAAKARSKSVPLGCFISAVVFPLLVGARRGWQPRTLVAPTLLSCVVMARRLTASLPDDATYGPAVHLEAWLYRLLYDRNTSK